ncbi:MAG: PepSY-like domain-containing protein [Saprospiraceae bacterium]|nr:PepSY-like domain-containing protein [Saprospiraceae bacterium]
MKKMLFFLSCILLVGVISCNKEAILDDNVLVEEIATSTAKEWISPAVLPEGIQEDLDLYNFDSYVEEVNYVSNAGYELIMGDEETIYYSEAGRRLHSTKRLFLWNRFGPCGGKGTWIKVEELSELIQDYVSTNYPDATIKGGKEKNDVILVLLDSRKILVFDLDGTFLKEAAGFYHCPSYCNWVEAAELPTEISDYISINYPDAEVKVACRKKDKFIVVGILTPDGRRVIVFDTDGNFLFTRP